MSNLLFVFYAALSIVYLPQILIKKWSFAFFLIILTTQHSCHFLSWGCISFVAYNVIPLYLSVKCLKTFAAVLCLSRKALRPPQKSSEGAGLLLCRSWAHFMHSVISLYEELLVEQKFLYRLTWTVKLSASDKDWILHFDVFKRCLWTTFCSFSCVSREYTQKYTVTYLLLKGILIQWY